MIKNQRYFMESYCIGLQAWNRAKKIGLIPESFEYDPYSAACAINPEHFGDELTTTNFISVGLDHDGNMDQPLVLLSVLRDSGNIVLKLHFVGHACWSAGPEGGILGRLKFETHPQCNIFVHGRKH